MRALPDGSTLRPLRLDDVGWMADLLAAAERVDDTGEHEDVEDLVEWFGNERLDLAADGRVVEIDGRPVAWVTAVDLGNHREAYTVDLDGRVHPEHRGRGIGRVLLDWQLGRAAELHRERGGALPGRFRVAVPSAMRSLEGLARRAGLADVRRLYEMERPLGVPVVARTVEGIEVVPFDWARDEEVRLVHNVAFAEHFGTADRDEHAWRSWFTGHRAFRPELSRLALADGAVVGYVLVYVYDADTRATGVEVAWLGQIGVLPEVRGRGVATAVMGASLAAAEEAGVQRAALAVDTENSTGALGLYERLGFAVVRRVTTWALEPPARTGAPAPAEA